MAVPARCPTGRVDVALVVGGRWHDMDFARRELLALLGQHDAVRCSVHEDFSDTAVLASADAVVAYTCDVRPSAGEAEALRGMVASGGRLLGLHATNSAIDPPSVDGPRVFRTPDAMPEFSALLGNRFLAHPRIAPVRVDVQLPDHPLVAGVPAFETTDEVYVSVLADDLEVILGVDFEGACPGFETDHVERSMTLPVLFTRTEGGGQVTYLTLGHCRGRFDVADMGTPDLGVVDHVAWESPHFREVLSRCVAWAVHGDRWPACPAKEAA